MESNFEQLTLDTLAKIKGFGIKSRSVFKTFQSSCRMLKPYRESNNLTFSFESGQKWLSEVRPQESFTQSQYVLYAGQRRTVFLLSECQKGKLDSWRIYPQKSSARPKTPEYLRLLHSHEENLQIAGMAKSTVSFAMRVNSDFLIYLEESGKFEINAITTHDITGYFACSKFSDRKPEGIKAYAYKLKSFLEFLEDAGAVTEKKLSLAVPKVFANQESIVTVLSEKAVKALRNKDYESTAGTNTRNHAMMLLALRLGIRRSDIIKLRFSEIDWKMNKISFIQQKTNVPITLPLLPDVGNAIMNYILNFRPQGTSDTVFLRHYAPYHALTPNTHMIAKLLSSFDSEDCPQRSFHILRRTCATGMLKINIPRSTISAAIGQTDPNSSDVYLSMDEDKMRKCCLSLKGIACGREDLQ